MIYSIQVKPIRILVTSIIKFREIYRILGNFRTVKQNFNTLNAVFTFFFHNSKFLLADSAT